MPAPKTINEPGVITVTGSYLTKERETRVQLFFIVFGIIGACLLLGPIGVVVGFIGAGIASLAWYWWLFPARLTFRFTADMVEVQGQAYSRAVPIAFTNRATDAIGVAYGDGSKMPDAYKVAKILRMVYGDNEFVLAECRRPAHASQFVMACTSALSRSQAFAVSSQTPAPIAVRRQNVTVTQLHPHHGQQPDQDVIDVAPEPARPARLLGSSRSAIVAGSPDTRRRRPGFGEVVFALAVFAGIASAVYYYEYVGEYARQFYGELAASLNNHQPPPTQNYRRVFWGIMAGLAALVLWAIYQAIGKACSVARRLVKP